MCEHTYTGCPHCEARATDGVYERMLSTELIKYPLNEDGEQNHDLEPSYDGETDSNYDGYECSNCGWYGQSLADELVPEDCECDECNPEEPDPEDPGEDPEEIVCIERTHDTRILIDADAPEEFRILATNRSIKYLPLPRWRLVALYLDHYNTWLNGRNFRVDLEREIPDHVVRDLMLDYSSPDQLELQEAA